METASVYASLVLVNTAVFTFQNDDHCYSEDSLNLGNNVINI